MTKRWVSLVALLTILCLPSFGLAELAVFDDNGKRVGPVTGILGETLSLPSSGVWFSLTVNDETVLASTNWYSGGSLHRATIKQWNDATYSNKLATAADWTLKVPGILRELLQSGTMANLRPYASQLVECVDEAGSGKGGERIAASEMAASCMILMGWK